MTDEAGRASALPQPPDETPIADPIPPSPDRSAALLFLAVRRGRSWEAKLRVGWTCPTAETPSPGPSSPASLQIDATPALDVTIWAHPPLAVPCPTRRARVGVRCVRPSGHQALDLHAARRVAADRAFGERYGPLTRIELVDGRWIIDPQGRAGLRPRPE